MFRKSPYLNQFPVFSLNVDAASDYQLREASRAEQHCTAEVAAALLQQAGDLPAADGLNQHFRYFRQQYLAGKPTGRRHRSQQCSQKAPKIRRNVAKRSRA